MTVQSEDELNALDELRRQVDASPGRRARVEAIKEDMRRELRLEELRAQHRVTQEQIATTLGVSQARVSKLEHQADARVSTLRAYVRALGGELEISAVFDDERIDLHLE